MSNTTLAAVTADLRTALPQGGSVHLRLDYLDGEEPYLFVEQVFAPGMSDEDVEAMPEDLLGDALYNRLDLAVNDAMDTGTLPGYTSGDKFYDITF